VTYFSRRWTRFPHTEIITDLSYAQPKAAPKTRVRGGKTVQRDPSKIKGIMLHQTAVNFGVAPYQVAAAGGSTVRAKQNRALNVGAHFVTFRDVGTVQAHDLLSYCHHGGLANSETIGWEIEGVYSGLLDNPRTTPREDLLSTWKRREPDEITERLVVHCRQVLIDIVEGAYKEGIELDYIYAHRQSSITRRSDPGEGLWRKIVEGFAKPVLGLTPAYAKTWGMGRTIPVQWSSHGKGEY